MCAEDEYIVGAKLQIMEDKGTYGDDRGLTGLIILCAKKCD